MQLNRESWAKLVLVGFVATAGGCREPAAAADTETETDTDVGTVSDTDPETGTDTDTETDTDDPPPVTTELTVEITFANEMSTTITDSLHIWVLRPKESATVSCSDLVADVIDPYDLQLIRLADHVSTAPAEPVVIPEVEVGEALVYVEGVSVVGAAEVAGCEGATLDEPSASVMVELGLAGTFDCGDAETEDGAPCDDGSFCTVGETCNNGSCQGGGVRDCSILADQCSAASCNETDGCVLTPVPNDTQCSDGLACTDGDSCQDGTCIGLPRDCDAEAPVCQQAVACAEPTGECVFVDADENLPCEDGLFCTIDTVCLSGQCVGNPMECPGDDCNPAVCDEDDDACSNTFADTMTICSDAENECTEATGLCDGAGTCNADPANEGSVCDNDGTPGLCELGVCV